ncbi:sulfotransferase family 2 domain-containing protein [Nocardioides sp. Kera G14]|uniref:sulfotransferase family 2 domain-containing protein n=1 Tax=Nocardioides sp. Kera G14 TaxID=2884264 RepID=UPI001D12F0C3|nr:sulfotransferase family 2 domain-containing protein [Nocardioides sp. Kera G14]UDY22668.1 sulfotransferase family protein [Nocardioides sp. Kera G14]
MPIFTKGERSVLFVHVPKTGGASFELAMIAAGWTRWMYEDDRAVVTRLTCAPQHFHAPLLMATVDVSKVDAVFMIVRDPVARFRSEYSWRRRGSRDPTLGAADVVELWLKDQLVRLADNPFHGDNHMRPQVEFALDDCDIYRFEEGLDVIAAGLDARFDLGISEHMGHVHDSSGFALPSSSVEINSTVEAMLREYYADDFRLLGY